jgi:hypothetical protein
VPLEPIRGWLLLPLLDLVTYPIRVLAMLAGVVVTARTTEALDRHWVQANAIAAVGTSALSVYCVVLLRGFLRRRAWVSEHMKYQYGARVFVGLVAYALSSVLLSGTEGAGGNPFTALVSLAWWPGLWMAYFERSVRVRNTFVR